MTDVKTCFRWLCSMVKTKHDRCGQRFTHNDPLKTKTDHVKHEHMVTFSNDGLVIETGMRQM